MVVEADHPSKAELAELEAMCREKVGELVARGVATPNHVINAELPMEQLLALVCMARYCIDLDGLYQELRRVFDELRLFGISFTRLEELLHREFPHSWHYAVTNGLTR